MNTEELTNKLKEYDNIDAFLTENEANFDENGFKAFLETLLQRENTNITKLALGSGVSVPYAHQLFNGAKNRPRKDILLRLAFGLALSLEETNRLLTLGGTSPLRAKVRRDSILIFCLNKQMGQDEADELLCHYGLATV
ncbi:MAG: helix-turn-helix domain-containing protein [Defluviitaleaceae bacterium]|nr:helix-turn-helix domain-containing protein [Defluviitaleaceae bacterium]MCL2275793.1 helix-turn-helix domain-containing protein [Defluviitaleaceae bacterium]